MNTKTKVINASIDDFMVESYTIKIISYEIKNGQIILNYVDGFTEPSIVEQFNEDFKKYKQSSPVPSKEAQAMIGLSKIMQGKEISDEEKSMLTDHNEAESHIERNIKIMTGIISSLNKILFDEEDNNKEIRNNIKIYNELQQQANKISESIESYFNKFCKETHILSKSDSNLYSFIAKERVVPLVEMPVPTADPFPDGIVYYKVNYIGSTDAFYVNEKQHQTLEGIETAAEQYILNEHIDFPFYAVSFNNSPRAIERVTL